MAQNFKELPVEYIRNPQPLFTFGNFNRCLDFAAETDYLQILHADDVIKPAFYETMEKILAPCDGNAMAWCLDDRIDEQGKLLSISGRADGSLRELDKDTFLARKAEIGNQAFCATLLKTNRQPIPARFPEDMPVMGDAVYWARYGFHCKQIFFLNQALAQYRWHGSTVTVKGSSNINNLIVDEWKVMEQVEALRQKKPGWLRMSKLKGIMAARSGIKAKRFREFGNPAYAKEITQTAQRYTGVPIWMAAQFLVELREIIFFKIGGRPKHPRNVYS